MLCIGDKVVHIGTRTEGTVVEIFDRSHGELYEVVNDLGRSVWGEEKEFERVESPAYRCDVEIADNVVVVRLLDASGDEVARGHGHIIHEGALGIAQAVSYASRRVLYVLDDKQPEGQKIYAKGENNYGFNTVRKNPATYERSRFNNSSRCL